MSSVLLRNGQAMQWQGVSHGAHVDIGIDRSGRVILAGAWDGRQPFDRTVDLRGAWISPAWVRVAKQVARAVGLPLIVHIGEAPPTLSEILDILEPGDVVTHCFTGRITTSIGRHEPYFRRVQDMTAQGLILDLGHGQGSFNYQTARKAVERGLLPHVISTDLHVGCIWGPAWDLATTMSKMLTVGMSPADVVERVTTGPAQFLRLEHWGAVQTGTPARFTIYEISESSEKLPDSDGTLETIRRFYEPRHTIIGDTVTPAARNTIRDRTSVSI